MSDHKILYSFRRCPYAMRARLALAACQISYELREISLKNKPEEFLQTSPKGTVPVLVLEEGTLIDESLDVVHWAIKQSDPENLGNLSDDQKSLGQHLIEALSADFTPALRRYKYFENYPEKTQQDYRLEAESYLKKLEEALSKTAYLVSDHLSYVDYIIFPFVRQCARVEENWFIDAGFDHLQKWWLEINESAVFQKVMQKYDLWDSSSEITFVDNAIN